MGSLGKSLACIIPFWPKEIEVASYLPFTSKVWSPMVGSLSTPHYSRAGARVRDGSREKLSPGLGGLCWVSSLWSSPRSQPSWRSQHLAFLGDGGVRWKSDLLLSLSQQLLKIGVIKG